MAILAVDVLIKTMCEAAFADLKKNHWILDDIYSGLATDPLAQAEFGYKEVNVAKNWFLDNDIQVYLNHRVDNPRFPCVTIVQTSSREMTHERTSLGDDGLLGHIKPTRGQTQPVQKIVQNFTPIAYNPQTGQVTMPSNLKTIFVTPGQFYVSQRSGRSYKIVSLVDQQNFTIAPGIVDDFTDGYIAPLSALWNEHRELTFMEESFTIGFHVVSDPAVAIWFRQLMAYIFLRYKEAYLESRGFALSTFSIGAIDENPYFQQADKVYSCALTLSGQVQSDFVKFIAPKLQSVTGEILISPVVQTAVEPTTVPLQPPQQPMTPPTPPSTPTPPAYQQEVFDQGWAMAADLPAIEQEIKQEELGNLPTIGEEGDVKDIDEGDEFEAL